MSDKMAPVIGRVRAYFAPVDRAQQQPTFFDPSQDGRFPVEAAPAPWLDLGWISGFTRTCGTKIAAVRTGAPAVAQTQVRSEVESTVRFGFERWGKLQLSLASGTQQMNVLASSSVAAPAGSGGAALPATALLSGTTASALAVGAEAASAFAVGSLVVVDADYAPGTTGFVGAGVSGAYLRTAVSDVDYVRRVSLNVGRVAAVNGGVLQLEGALPAGMPSAGMKASQVLGLCDREGSSFFQEWSALFVAEGQQGERVVWHYPRLQASAGIAEEGAKSFGGYETLRGSAHFRALPVVDPIDGERVVCFRSFFAA